MDKAILKRHNFIYLADAGRRKIFQSLQDTFQSPVLEMAEEIFCGPVNIPGFARRGGNHDNILSDYDIPLGFVHYRRISGNRLRIGAYGHSGFIIKVSTPYEVLAEGALHMDVRTRCMEAAAEIYGISLKYGIAAGILGSAGLELATGLHYTDGASDLDFLIKPAPLPLLKAFYDEARSLYPGINMDFEVDFPNGYGVKLAELFMDTRTVLGKSIDNISLLSRKDIIGYLT